MEKKPVVKLRVFRGKELNYDASGNVKNENQIVSLEHGTKQWVLFMKNLPLNGYCKVQVEKAFKTTETASKDKDGKDVLTKTYDEIKDVSVFEKEVSNSFNVVAMTKKTPEQTRIEALEAKLEAMSNEKPKKVEVKETKETKEVKEEKPAPKEDGGDIKDEYMEVFGKKPFHGWDDETLKEKIAEEKAK